MRHLFPKRVTHAVLSGTNVHPPRSISLSRGSDRPDSTAPASVSTHLAYPGDTLEAQDARCLLGTERHPDLLSTLKLRMTSRLLEA